MSDTEPSDDDHMNVSKTYPTRILLTALVLLAEIGHLAWEHLHGGVLAHHIAANPDLPAISNWWGLILLPGLGWLLIGRIQKRYPSSSPDQTPNKTRALIWVGFAASLVFGVALASSFMLGYETVSNYMVLALFPLALVFPIHRSEYVLGVILGMTFTFGAVLPTVFASVFAGISAGASFVIRFFRRRFAS
jgi:hypothetical protein